MNAIEFIKALHQLLTLERRQAEVLADTLAGQLLHWTELPPWESEVPAECRQQVAQWLLSLRGAYVRTKGTKKITLRLPKEFVTMCRDDRTHPETVLRGFIADLCEITNWVHCPRDDGYSSNGSDERMLAREYYERVGYTWFKHDS